MGDCRSAARASEPPDARSWAQVLARYREPNHARSIVEIAITLGPLVALWVLAWVGYYLGFWWLSLLIAVPAAGFLVRLFMIQRVEDVSFPFEKSAICTELQCMRFPVGTA